jgi:hypothetical protein
MHHDEDVGHLMLSLVNDLTVEMKNVPAEMKNENSDR